MMAAGALTQLGDPIKTYQSRVKQTVLPTGLIHDFYSLIKFGVMVFNTDGATSGGATPECVASGTSTQITCTAGSRDGGKIVSYIEPSDDTTILNAAKQPLIDSINAITASTWTPYAESFYNAIGYFAGNTNMRLNAADFDTANPPVNYTCRQNNILLVTDGVSTADLNATKLVDATTLFTPASSPDGDNDSDNSCLAYNGSKYVDDLSWLAKHRKITDITNAASTPTKAAETITTYTVFNGEDSCLSSGSNTPTCALTDECSSAVLLYNTAINGGGAFYNAGNSAALQTSLRSAFLAVSAKAASGTAASVLGEKSREGSNILQAVFYPSKLFNITSPSSTITRSWLGYLNNFWFYEDTNANIANIREDTVQDKLLNLTADNIVSFDFVNDQLVVHSWTSNANGTPATALADKTLDDVQLIWEGGKILFKRATARKIYVNDDGITYPKSPIVTFTTANKGSFGTNLGADLNNDGFVDAADVTQADRLIDYVIGTDYSEYRNRTLPLNNPVDPTVSGTWKMGDIIHSTPQIVKYDNIYSDYSVAYVGANDGMLHAFKVGKLDSTGLSGTQKAQLTVGTKDSIVLGEELWAFIPKNALPYMRYYADPGYCHNYMVDLSPYLYSYGSHRI
ncbi:Tfp pilus assembly protein tip-associated adhesin PilY1-like protein, partial [Candidatus Magnetobacterium bavaricum]